MGAYRLGRLLGQGGVGEVYEAVHEQLGRRAAIKVLLPTYSRDPQMVQRFFTEARAANRVQHPGLVNVYEMGAQPDGTAYIVMEFLAGETLGRRLQQRGVRPLGEALRLGRQVASALQAAHAHGVIHRDLKPDNVMIVRDPDMPGGERAKVLDFGLAKVLEEQRASLTGQGTRTGMVMGTPRYMAPEQCRGVRGITDRADVYALGVMLYHMLAGRPPFNAEAVGDLLVMHIRMMPRPLRDVAPAVPEEVAGLVHMMLAKRPESRPSMAQVTEALEGLGPVTGRVELAPRVGESGRLPTQAADSGRQAAGSGPLAARAAADSGRATPGRVAVPLGADDSLPASPSMFVDGSGAVGDPLDGYTEDPEMAGASGDGASQPGFGPQPSLDMPAGESTPELSALGGDEANEDSLVVPRHRAGRVVLWMAALALLVAGGLWLGRAGKGVNWARQVLRGPERPAPDGEAALLLLRSDRALQTHAWEQAHTEAGRALAMPGISEATREAARQRIEQATREGRAQGAYERFGAAVAARRLDEAMASFRELPPESQYRRLGRSAYEKAFPGYATAHLERARAARGAGRCAEFAEQVDAVLLLEPRHAPTLRLKARGCGGRGEDEPEDSASSGPEIQGGGAMGYIAQPSPATPSPPVLAPPPVAARPPVAAPPRTGGHRGAGPLTDRCRAAPPGSDGRSTQGPGPGAPER